MAGPFDRSRVRLLWGRHFVVERTTTIDNSAVDDLFRVNRVQAARAGIATLRFVRVGPLDDPATIPPDVHIYVRSVRGDSLAERGGFEPLRPFISHMLPRFHAHLLFSGEKLSADKTRFADWVSLA